MLVCWTLPDYTPLLPSEDWPDGPDTTETLTWKSIFRNSHLPKSSRSSGTELPSLSEDSQLNKSSNNTSTHSKQFWTKVLKSSSLLQVKQPCWSVQQSAPIWVASPFLIWVTIMDTFAFATVQFMTSLVESDKDPLFRTCPTLITRCMKMEPLFVSKLSNSQENHLSDSGLDLFVLIKYFLFRSTHLFHFYFRFLLSSFDNRNNLNQP